MCFLSRNELFVLFKQKNTHKKISLEAEFFFLSLSQFILKLSAGAELESCPRIIKEILLLVFKTMHFGSQELGHG